MESRYLVDDCYSIMIYYFYIHCDEGEIMNYESYNKYIQILKEELVPAMGCTEPIALAYGAAYAKSLLGKLPDQVSVCVSGNLIKNAKSVFVPNTNGLRGIPAAVVAGLIAGDYEKKLEVISQVSEEQQHEISEYLATHEIKVELSDSSLPFDYSISLVSGEDSTLVRIVNAHTNIVFAQKNGDVIIDQTVNDEKSDGFTNHECLNIEDIVEFASNVNLEEISFCLEQQINYNEAIAKEGLHGNYGANIGQVLLTSYGDNVVNRAKAKAAAASDARMNGCALPVVILSGSGNQGITASLPVIEFAKTMNASHELLLRSLIVSNLVAIRQKTEIGRLSAFCGGVCAGVGAGAGICYLEGGRYHEISHTIVNALAIASGIICDGAKASCAAKIALSVEAGITGWYMFKNGQQFRGGDGIVSKGVENTIRNVGRLGHDGMKETDREILKIMTE